LEQHGGVIEVENPPDGGTTFIVRLPVHATDEEEEAG
jgi:signal transduction histidine kinase